MKYLLFVVNLIFVFAGVALVFAGQFVKIQIDQYYDFLGNVYIGPGVLLVAVGVFIFFSAFLGCYGAYKENYCFIQTYAVCLGAIFVLEVSGGVAGIFLRERVENNVEHVLKNSVKNYGKVGHGVLTGTWDKVQKEFECCGVHNFSDWIVVDPYAPPNSCCKDGVSAEDCDARSYKNTEAINTGGCSETFKNYLSNEVAVIAGVSIGLASGQFVAILLACSLARAIRKGHEPK